MAELGECRRVEPGEPGGGDPLEPGCEAGVDDVDLGVCGRAGPQSATPCWEAEEEEQVFEQRDIAASRSDIDVDGPGGGADVEYLTGLGGQPGE